MLLPGLAPRLRLRGLARAVALVHPASARAVGAPRVEVVRMDTPALGQQPAPRALPVEPRARLPGHPVRD